jgi:hypothetical protein
MKNRCTNPKHPKYSLYGGKGIRICERWLLFENFFEDMGERPEGMTLERIDGNLGYGLGNCKWATYVEQNNNKSDNRKILFMGQIHTRKELAMRLQCTTRALDYRLTVTNAYANAKNGVVEYVEKSTFSKDPCKGYVRRIAPSHLQAG